MSIVTLATCKKNNNKIKQVIQKSSGRITVHWTVAADKAAVSLVILQVHNECKPFNCTNIKIIINKKKELNEISYFP